MIASWRGLAVAAAIAVVLAVLVILDVARTTGPADRALLPGFDPVRATELVWDRAGQPVLRAVRTGDRWELRAPATIPADAGAIGDVLAALRGARWHRPGDPRPAHATLTVIAGAERHAIGLAEPIAGTEQSWIVADGRGVVVDSWVVRALDRDRLGLQIRRPLADVAGARSIAITGAVPGAIPGSDPSAGTPIDLQLEGSPRRLVRPGPLLLAPEVAGELERALREVTIVRIPDGPLAARVLTLRVVGAAPETAEIVVGLGTSCPGAPQLAALSGTAGDGCIERADAVAIARAVDQLLRPPAVNVERRPVPFEPRHVVLADGVALDTAPLRVGDAAADPARVYELLAALAAPATAVALPAGPPTGHITASDRAGAAIMLDLFAGRVLVRRGEPIALSPPPGMWSLLVRPSRELREPTLWLEEPTTITALVIDDVRYQRGAVIGEWSRQPAGRTDAARVQAQVEALVAQLAAPRAIGFVDDRVAVAHRVTLEVTPPVGAATRHALELGAPRADGCPARAGRDTVALPAAICSEIAALLR